MTSETPQTASQAVSPAVSPAMSPTLSAMPLLKREPVYYRFRHSLEEKWHYGPQPQNWWVCEPIFALSDNAASANATRQVFEQVQVLAGAAREALYTQSQPAPLLILEVCEAVESLILSNALPFAAPDDGGPALESPAATARLFSEAEVRHAVGAMWADGRSLGEAEAGAPLAAWQRATTPEDWAAFKRFQDCVQDDEGYDVSAEQMSRLADLGLVRKVRGSVYEFTQFGLVMQGCAPADAADEPQQYAAT